MAAWIRALVSAVVQLILFSLIPLIWWLVTARKKTPFLQWLGLKRVGAADKKGLLTWCAGGTLAFMLLLGAMLYALRDVETAASQFDGLGLAALPMIFLYAAVQTGLSEEIVFRGFLLKRFAAKCGFQAGNAVQSILFGALHGVMFCNAAGLGTALLIALLTGGLGWCMGYINEKKADGSILPSWCIHACGNIFSGVCSAFLLFH